MGEDTAIVVLDLGPLAAFELGDGVRFRVVTADGEAEEAARRTLSFGSFMSVPLTFVMFDLLWKDGDDLTGQPYSERRNALEGLDLRGSTWTTADTYDDGPALFTAVCRLGFEGVVAKKHASLYRPNDRGWVKVKNPNYWRRDAERDAMQRSAERRTRVGSRL